MLSGNSRTLFSRPGNRNGNAVENDTFGDLDNLSRQRIKGHLGEGVTQRCCYLHGQIPLKIRSSVSSLKLCMSARSCFDGAQHERFRSILPRPSRSP